MAQVGRRLIFINNKLVADLGEMEGDILPREVISSLQAVDLDFGQYADEIANSKEVQYDGTNIIFIPRDENKSPLTYQEQLEYRILVEGGYVEGGLY